MAADRACERDVGNIMNEGYKVGNDEKVTVKSSMVRSLPVENLLPQNVV